MPKIKPVDARSEKYFASLLLRRDSVPTSYSAVDADLVSSVKDQLNCGSCVAFGLHLSFIVTKYSNINFEYFQYLNMKF